MTRCGPFWSVETLTSNGHDPISCALAFMVGEMHAHVQGASPKACITDLMRFFELPDHQRFIAGGLVAKTSSRE